MNWNISSVKSSLKDGNLKLLKCTSGKSDVWKIFDFVVESATEKKTGFVQCVKCRNVLSFTSSKTGTSHLKRHKCVTGDCEREITDYLKPCSKKIPSEAKENLTRILVEFCAKDVRPFEIVNGDGFKRLAQTFIEIGSKLGNIAATEILSHATTISRHILERTNHLKTKLIPELNKVLTQKLCAATTDMWTDDYKKVSYTSLTLHYINDEWKLVKNILFATNFPVEQIKTGVNIRKELIRHFVNFGLKEELFDSIVFVTDQGANIVNALNSQLRFSCILHILNTVLRHTFDFKFIGDIAPNICETISGCKDLVTYMKQSGCVKLLPKTLHQEVDSRWNSKFHMLFSVHEQYKNIIFVLEQKCEMGRMDAICPDALADLVTMLQPFKEASDDLEGDKYPTFHKVMLWYFRLLKICGTERNEDGTQKYKTAEIKHVLQRAISYVKTKLIITMENKMATFICPRFKQLRMLTEEERNSVKERVLIEAGMENYFAVATGQIISDADEESPKKKKKSNDFSEWEDIPVLQESNSRNELEEYLASPTYDDKDLLLWWKNNRNHYPKLARLARKLLCIPATSASSERVFSAAGRILEERRTSLRPEIVDSLLFLHDNL